MLIFIKKSGWSLKSRELAGGRGLSQVGGRTKQQDKGNYMRRFII
jgi:hypothetical protein